MRHMTWTTRKKHLLCRQAVKQQPYLHVETVLERCWFNFLCEFLVMIFVIVRHYLDVSNLPSTPLIWMRAHFFISLTIQKVCRSSCCSRRTNQATRPCQAKSGALKECNLICSRVERMFCQSATLLLGHVGPAVCVCLFLDRMKGAIQACLAADGAEPNNKQNAPKTHICMHAI